MLGIIQPYAPLVLEDAGLTDAQIGSVIALFGIAVFITPPLLGALADLHLQPRRLIACIFIVMAVGLCFFGMAQGYTAAAIGYAVLALCINPTFPVSDALHFRMQQERPAGEPETPFHKIRVWGAYGFILPAIPLAILLPDDGIGPRLAMAFGAVVSLLTILNTRRLPAVRHEPSKRSLANFPTWTAAKRLFKPDARWFCLSVLLFSSALSAYYGFYPLHLRDLGIEDRYVALIASFGVLAEIGCTLIFGTLMAKIGLRNILILGAASLCARLLLLYLVQTPEAAIISQVFHGPAMLLLVIGTPIYLNQLASDSDRTSIQGVFAPLVFGMGRTFGPLVAGFIAGEQLGTVFGVGACLTAFAVVTLALGFREPERSDSA